MTRSTPNLRPQAVRAAWAAFGLVIGCAAAGDGMVRLAGGTALVEPSATPMKPYVKELRTPSGVQFLDDSPPDHFHHHGLMLAVSVNGIDFWAERPSEDKGRQVPIATETAGGTAVVQRLRWTAPDGVVILEEVRRIDVAAGGTTSPTVLTWRSELRPPEEAGRSSAGGTMSGLGCDSFPSSAARSCSSLRAMPHRGRSADRRSSPPRVGAPYVARSVVGPSRWPCSTTRPTHAIRTSGSPWTGPLRTCRRRSD